MFEQVISLDQVETAVSKRVRQPVQVVADIGPRSCSEIDVQVAVFLELSTAQVQLSQFLLPIISDEIRIPFEILLS